MLDFPEQGEDFLLERIAAARDRVRRGGQLKVNVVIRQELRDGHLVKAEPDLGLLAEKTKAGHGRLDRLHVHTPQINKEHNLQLELCMFGHRYVAAHVGAVLVVQQEHVAQEKNLAQPLEHICVVVDLVLHKLLRYGEEHLRADAPERVYGRLGVPFLNVFLAVKHQERLHGRVCHIKH